MKTSMHLNTTVFDSTEDSWQSPRKRAQALALLSPHMEVSTDLTGPEWANLLAIPEVTIENKMLLTH